jgi:uncharacterized protein YodC (DUF2158 family)
MSKKSGTRLVYIRWFDSERGAAMVTEENTFKPGDTAMLRSEGPSMTVMDVGLRGDARQGKLQPGVVGTFARCQPHLLRWSSRLA